MTYQNISRHTRFQTLFAVLIALFASFVLTASGARSDTNQVHDFLENALDEVIGGTNLSDKKNAKIKVENAMLKHIKSEHAVEFIPTQIRKELKPTQLKLLSERAEAASARILCKGIFEFGPKTFEIHSVAKREGEVFIASSSLENDKGKMMEIDWRIGRKHNGYYIIDIYSGGRGGMQFQRNKYSNAVATEKTLEEKVNSLSEAIDKDFNSTC